MCTCVDTKTDLIIPSQLYVRMGNNNPFISLGSDLRPTGRLPRRLFYLVKIIHYLNGVITGIIPTIKNINSDSWLMKVELARDSTRAR